MAVVYNTAILFASSIGLIKYHPWQGVIILKSSKDTKTHEYRMSKPNPDNPYREITVGKTTYRVTSEFLGTVDLAQTLERLAISRVLAELEAQTKAALLEE